MRKEMIFMKNRTNNQDRIFQYISVSIIPIFLVILIALSGVEKSFEKIIYAGAVLSNPQILFNQMNENEKTDYIDEKANIDVIEKEVSAVVTSSVPLDIQKLIKQAEKTYENSSNDGKIIEKDYSKQNATAELNGIYVRNTTLQHDIDIQKYLNGKVYADVHKKDPSVLIYHTHTTETYELLDRGFYTNERSSRSEKSGENMIRVGEEICKVLEKNGYKTIHDKTVYDKKYSGAYERSCENISKILKENPSIQIVLDIHRDAIYQKDGSRVKPVAEIGGRKAAQIMIISGCEDGNVTNFPNWEKNLSFAVQLQNKLKNDNPQLVRPLMFCSRKYNMHLTTGSMLLEVGTDSNSFEEAKYSAELAGDALLSLLNTLK
jgi:stage II sporulation protein P